MFEKILGQKPAIETLTRALGTGRVHHAYRFEGPDGVGKEFAAFALAQSLVCEAPTPLACGKCSACRRAVRLSEEEPRVPTHPDVVLLERGLYPPSAIGAKSAEITSIGVEQIRAVVLSRVGLGPHEGRALTFIVRRAHELSTGAANALLKTLEEPPSATHFILLTHQPKRLLPTIRSRTLPVRFGPLPEKDLASILAAHGKPPGLARYAGGSAGAALGLSDEELSRSRDDFVKGVEAAIRDPHPEGLVLFAGTRPDDRDTLQAHLAHLSQHFALDARDHVRDSPERASTSARRHALVLEAIDAVSRNAQPGLALESMVSKLRAV